MNYQIVDEKPVLGLRRIMADNKYGLIDDHNNVVCEAAYEKIGLDEYWLDQDQCSLAEKRIPVCQNGLWGFIDINGRVVVSPQYLEYCSFRGQYTTVTLLDKNLGQDPVIHQYYLLIDRYGNSPNVLKSNVSKCESIELCGDRRQYAVLWEYHLKEHRGRVEREYYPPRIIDLESIPYKTPQFICDVIEKNDDIVKIELSDYNYYYGYYKIKITTKSAEYVFDISTEKLLSVHKPSFLEKTGKRLWDICFK